MIRPSLFRPLRAVFVACLCAGAGAAHFYQQSFTNAVAANPEWQTGWFYGRQGAVVPNAASSAVDFNATVANRMALRGNPNSGTGYDRSGQWVGRWAWMTNQFTGSATDPFGIEVVRTSCALSVQSTGGATVSDSRYRVYVGICLWQDTSPAMTKSATANARTYEWSYVKNYLDFMDQNACYGLSNGDIRQSLGYYNGVEVSLNACFSNAIGPDGVASNIAAVFLWNYSNVSATPLRCTNTNNVGFRLVNNGSTLGFFANPDPLGLTGGTLPNAWYLLTNIPVTFSSNLQFAIGHAVRMNAGDGQFTGGAYQIQSGDFARVLVRSATSGSTFRAVEPDDGALAWRVEAWLAPDDAGVHALHWAPPDGASRLEGAVGTEGARLAVTTGEGRPRLLRLVPWRADRWPSPEEASWRRDARGLHFVFGEPLRPPAAGPTTVRIDARFPAAARRATADLGSFTVDAELRPGMPERYRDRWGTCGEQRATPASDATVARATRSGGGVP